MWVREEEKIETVPIHCLDMYEGSRSSIFFLPCWVDRKRARGGRWELDFRAVSGTGVVRYVCILKSAMYLMLLLHDGNCPTVRQGEGGRSNMYGSSLSISLPRSDRS